MKILVVADEEAPVLWDFYQPGRLDGIDLILSAGDLEADYLSFLATFCHGPVVYVSGNHDRRYEEHPPEGCIDADGKVIEVRGVRILGLGGSMRYSQSSNQYTEREMRSRVRRLGMRLQLRKGFDILLTHAPARGIGDEDDLAHRGFEVFGELMERYQPRLMVHGHVHRCYTSKFKRERLCGKTRVVNACGWYILEL